MREPAGPSAVIRKKPGPKAALQTVHTCQDKPVFVSASQQPVAAWALAVGDLVVVITALCLLAVIVAEDQMLKTAAGGVGFILAALDCHADADLGCSCPQTMLHLGWCNADVTWSDSSSPSRCFVLSCSTCYYVLPLTVANIACLRREPS